jgi:cytochrome P450
MMESSTSTTTAATFSTALVVAIVTVIIASLYLAFVRFKLKRQSTKPYPQLPSPPGWHWAGGHLVMMGGKYTFQQSITQMCITHANQHGQTGIWIAQKRGISVTSAKDALTVLHSSNYREPVRHIRHHMSQFLGSRNIGYLSGREWKYHRAAILRAFSPSEVDHAQQAVVGVCGIMVTSLRSMEGQKVDMEPMLKMITMDIFGRSALSRDLKCCATLQPSAIAQAFDLLGQELTKRLYSPLGLASNNYWIPTKANRHHRQQRALIRNFIQDIVAERQSMTTSQAPKDALTCLLTAHSEQAGTTQEEAVLSQTLTDVLMSLLFAGYDTTSITLTYALYNLAKNPKMEQECLAEINNRFNSTSPNPNNLVYCRAILMETLRLYPPGNATTRTLTKDVELEGGFVAPAGTFMFIPIWAIQRKGEYYPLPEEFLPERWVAKTTTTTTTGVGDGGVWQERSEGDFRSDMIAPANRSAFLAFSAGARSCAGSRFAFMEMTLILASLLKDIHFSVDPDYVVEPERAGIVQRPKGGMPMKVEFR